MANGSDDSIVPGGGGPGKEFAKLTKHVLPLGLYLIALTAILLGLLIGQWPRCETDMCKAGGQVQSGTAAGAPPTGGAPAPTGGAGPSSSGAAGSSTTTASAAGAATTAAPPTAPSKKPVAVSAVEPASGSICGGTAVRVSGSGFPQDAQPEVRFGGVAATAVSVEKDTMLNATTPMHSEGPVDVSVTVKESSDVLSKRFTFICPDRTQGKLLLLVVLAGALGGALHAGRSLYFFVGNRNLRVSWLWMYYLLPLNGAVIGTLFFLVMVAGLFSVQGTSAQSFLLTIGVAALVGMFSQEAVEKLKQIAEAILTKVPPSADQKPKPLTVTAVDPPKGPTAGGTAVVITGTGFAQGATVTFGGAAATGVKVTSERIDAVAPPHAAGKVDVEVCNPDSGKAKKAGGFEYTDAPDGGGQAPVVGGPQPPPVVGGPPPPPVVGGPQPAPVVGDAQPAPVVAGPPAPVVGGPPPPAPGAPAPSAASKVPEEGE